MVGVWGERGLVGWGVCMCFRLTPVPNPHPPTQIHKYTNTQAAMLGRLDALMNFAPGLGGAGAAGGDGSNGLAAVAAGQFDDAEDEEEHGEGGEQGANEHGATVGQGEDELPQ